jgi:hypothetical protein
MTDKELKSKVERLRLEQEYTKLTKGDVQNGKSIVDSIIKDSAKSVGTTVLTAAGLYAIKQTLAKRYGQDFVDKMFAKKK